MQHENSLKNTPLDPILGKPSSQTATTPPANAIFGQISYYTQADYRLRHFLFKPTISRRYQTFNILKPTGHVMLQQFNILNTKRNLLYIRNQSIPRSKHFPPRL